MKNSLIRKYSLLLLLSFIVVVLPVVAQEPSIWPGFLFPIPQMPPGSVHQVASTDTSSEDDDSIYLPPHQKFVMAHLQGPGIIQRLWLTISSRDPFYLRRLVLRMYWDDEKEPSVEVPIGDFFGTGFAYRHYTSLLLGMSSGGFYCYFPMPFQKSARIEVENQSDIPVDAFYYQITYRHLDQPLPAHTAYFHAQWRRQIQTRSRKNYVIVEARGKGFLVGINVNLQGYHGSLGFLEGDEMIYVDGQSTPVIQGTGTEDYFNSGWYFRTGEFAAPFHGLIVKDDSLARIAAYRFHILDPIPFQKSLRFTIEHGRWNEVVADYSSTAYWYQVEPHSPFPPLLPASLRIPLRRLVPPEALQAEKLNLTGTYIRYRVQDMSRYGPEWGGQQQIFVEPINDRARFSLVVPKLSEEQYRVTLYMTKGPQYGNWYVNGENGKKVWLKGYAKKVEPPVPITLGALTAHKGKLALEFRVGEKDSSTQGQALGLDAVLLKLVRHFINRWMIIGPFPNPLDASGKRLGLDTVYPPEKEVDTSRTYTGVKGQKVKWHAITAQPNGYVQLWNRFHSFERVVCYALTYLHSPRKQKTTLLLGSDDGVKVFVNGQQVFRWYGIRVAQPDQDAIPIQLKKGWNTILVKIENNLGGYGFFARIPDTRHELTFGFPNEQ